MNAVKCPNNHYYDADQYHVCPHCGARADRDKLSKQEPLDSENKQYGKIDTAEYVTVALNDFLLAELPVSCCIPQPNPSIVQNPDTHQEKRIHAVKCPNNHYYDSELFDSCPHCASLLQRDMTPTEKDRDRHHIEYTDSESVTIALNTDNGLDSDSVEALSDVVQKKEINQK